MKKKISCAIILLFICVFCALPAFADENVYITDDIGVLDEYELSLLNTEAQRLTEESGVGIYFVFTDSDYCVFSSTSNKYIAMIQDETGVSVRFSDTFGSQLSEADKSVLIKAYDAESTYYGGVLSYIDTCRTLLNSDPVRSRLYDGAGLLNSYEAAALSAKLNSISETYSVDVIIATVDSVGNLSADAYAEYYYDSSDFGYGSSRDGVLLLLSMRERDYRILSNGLGASAFTMDFIDSVGNKIVPYLSDGDYYEAFDLFADLCEYNINGTINGFPFDVGTHLIVSVIVGFVIALVSTGIMAGQLKSVRAQSTASGYTKENSMKLTSSKDLFLYRNVSRIKIEKSPPSSSGGRSGGGSRHVGGGKF